MTAYDKLANLFDEMGIIYSTDWSFEVTQHSNIIRTINWIYFQEDGVEVDFKFDSNGRFEGIGIQSLED